MAVMAKSKKMTIRKVAPRTSQKAVRTGAKNALHSAIAVLVLGLLAFGVYRAVHSSLFRLNHVDVEALSEGYPLRPEQILHLARIPLGQWNLYEADLSPVEQRLMQQPWVKGVILGKEFPNTLSLKIVERKPVALLNGSDGHVVYLEEDGTTFEDQAMVYPRDLPILTGFSADNVYMLKKVNHFIETWFSPEKMPKLKLSAIHLDEKVGLRAMIAYPMKNQKQMRTVLELGLNLEEASEIPQTKLLKVLNYLAARSMPASKIWLGDGKKIVVKLARRP